jgi:hypothetical protein
VVAAVAVVSVLAGCASIPDRTITRREAVGRIEGYLGETFREVPSELRFSRIIDPVYEESTSACVVPGTGSGFTGQIEPGVLYEASSAKVQEREIDRFVAAVVAHWRSAAAEVEQVGTGTVRIYPYRDRYLLVVSYYPSVKRVRVHGVLGECIWSEGTAPPETRY